MKQRRGRQPGRSGPSRPAGSFPKLGPVTYLPISPAEVAQALLGACPPTTIWYHATLDSRLHQVCAAGVLPSCWWGGDSCCVFGYDRIEDVPGVRSKGWILEVESAALAGDLKAWWVPPTAIRGAWRGGTFHRRGDLAGAPSQPPDIGDGCSCDLTELVSSEKARWRQTLATKER